MKPIRAFLPRLISPPHVAGPSARTSPALNSWPGETIGTWLTQVLWFERINLISSKVSSFPELYLTSILSALTFLTTPSSLAKTQTPESTPAWYSIPVATIGASERRSGTACFCMFAPMSARFASSFPKKGIIAVATETIILGETSMKSAFSRSTSMN